MAPAAVPDEHGQGQLSPAFLTVHIVEDDPDVAASLATLFVAQGWAVAQYPDAEALLSAAPLAPGCMVLDRLLPGMDGLTLLRTWHARGDAMPTVIISGHLNVALTVQAMQAGAMDVIEKPYTQKVMLAAVRRAMASVRAAPVTKDGHAVLRLAALTPRERDVMRGLMRGKSNKEIGAAFGISPRTVEIHRAHLMEKLGCRSLADAIRLGILGGLDSAANGLGRDD